MMRATAEKMSAEDKKKNKETRQEIQLAKIACGTITLFILSWISYAIVTMLAINGYLFLGVSQTHDCDVTCFRFKRKQSWLTISSSVTSHR